MLQSNINTTAHKVQRIYFYISIAMLLMSGALFGIGSLYAKAVSSAPKVILYFATYLVYYHFAHLIFGIGSIFYYIRKIRKKLISMKLYQTVVGILITPVSAIILYAAVLLLALTNCSS